MKNEEHGSSRELSHTVSSPLELPGRWAVDKYLAPGPWTYTHGLIFAHSLKGGDCHIADVRAWGYFTGSGHGALGLSQEEGAAAQDGIREFIVAAINAALAAEEQVAGSWSREANETDWKARCEAAEQALAEALDLLLERKQGSPARSSAHNARLVIEAALNPTPQGGKPDSEEEAP